MKTIGAGALLKDLCAKLDPVGIYEHPPLPESHTPNGLFQVDSPMLISLCCNSN